MNTTTVADLKIQAKRLCDDLEEVSLRGTWIYCRDFENYDIEAAERELNYLKKEYIRLTGTGRGFPSPIGSTNGTCGT
jgi:hypothetical protein